MRPYRLADARHGDPHPPECSPFHRIDHRRPQWPGGGRRGAGQRRRWLPGDGPNHRHDRRHRNPGLLLGPGTLRQKAQRPSGASEPLLLQLKRIRSNPRFLLVLGLYLLLWFGLQLMQVVALIWLVQVIHLSQGLSTWILLPFQISALAGLQIWSLVSNRRGRLVALRWGGGLWIAACLWSMAFAPLAPGASGWALAPLIALISLVGIGASTAYLIPWSLLPDAIDADPAHPAGMYTAWMVLGQKLIIGLSMSVFGGLLSLTGYISSQTCDGALNFIEQPDTALLAIRLCMGLIPAGLVAIGLMVMRLWPDRGAHLQQS